MQGFVLPLPSGDAGIRATVSYMQSFARAASLDPVVRQTSVSIIEAKNPEWSQARALSWWMAGRTTFLPDPTYGEALHDPRWVLDKILTTGRASVDCDDVAMLAAAMGLSIGLRARFVVVAFNSPQSPYSHIWTELGDPRRGGWLPVDPTRPAQGLASARISRAFRVDV